MKKEKIVFKNGLIDLAQPRLGTKVIYKTDDFFASAHRIINPAPAVWKEGVFDTHGKWMDGWESRRKRTSGHDYLILKLGKPGRIKKIDVDTSHFNGNQPSMVSLEGCSLSKNQTIKQAKWFQILGKKKTKANSHHFFSVLNNKVITHVKFNIFPDGGVARLRLYGNIATENIKYGNQTINLTAMVNGASVIACNNEHFGKAENVLSPGVGINMGDGWETRRSRGKNFDWIIIKFGMSGIINKLEIDTHHFKGNYPDSFTVQSALVPSKLKSKKIINSSKKWKFFLGKTKLNPHKKHIYKSNRFIKNKVNCLRINIFPDGGISRVRAFGKVVK